jgi:hypothetical protein
MSSAWAMMYSCRGLRGPKGADSEGMRGSEERDNGQSELGPVMVRESEGGGNGGWRKWM